MTTVLLVDDEEDTVLIFSMLLSARGYRVESAREGNEALEKIGVSTPDVLVTDWAMPGLDGAGLCATLRAAGSPFSRIPIIVASATHLFIDGEHTPCDGVLRKPFSADELVRKIEAVARSSPADEAA